jgi:cyclohexa-1,5-dienecarbonyl-CoA hydratase
VTLEIGADTATITLDRPPLNILTLTMIRELAAALEVVAGQPRLKAVALAASGKAFSAGVDVADHADDRVEPMIREFGELVARLRELPVPTIAVVQGRALGGGLEMAVACDLVLAAASTQLGQPEIKVGVFPPVAAALFPGLIGYQQAARLIFTGETIGAEEALRLGLVTWVVPDVELPAALAHLLDQLAGLSAAVLGIARRALRLGAETGAAEALTRIEDLYLYDLLRTEDAHEGVAAFLEKRRPAWHNA